MDPPLPSFPAPTLPYRPRDPRRYRPAIALLGCGGISKDHLRAYSAAGYNVVALCDIEESRAKQRQAEFYPQADIYTDYRELLRRDDVEVVDIATHPPVRAPMIEAALAARKHVLSQKPFVLDMDFGQRMVDLADRQGVRLAVNQNGRWAPHFSYLREAIAAGHVGEVLALHQGVHWDHSWVAGTEFENVRHLILYDYAIHYFDFLACVMGPRRPLRVFASFARTRTQTVRPALLGQALIEYEDAQATLVFDGDTRFGRLDHIYVAGSVGSLSSWGASHREAQITLTTAQGQAQPLLEGRWFPDGFHGTMGELLCAIEENREPSHSAANNLRSLALCFAAVASAETHQPVVPGDVRRLM